MAHQWHREPDGAYAGLRYEQFGWARAAERANPHARPLPELMDVLQALEIKARKHLNEPTQGA